MHALSALVVSFLAFGALPAIAQTTWVVDDDGGAGVHFTSLPAAVVAAASGDTLVVRAGHYEPFRVYGKALTVLGAGPGATFVDGPYAPSLDPAYVSIGFVPVAATFRMSGVAIVTDLPTHVFFGMSTFVTRLHIGGTGPASTGAVVLADVESVPLGATAASGGQALTVQAATVHASRCVFRSGFGGAIDTWHGADGVVVKTGGQFAADACMLQGGTAVAASSMSFQGVRGGHGLVVVGSTAHATRCTIRGGDATAPSGSFADGGRGVLGTGDAHVVLHGTATDAVSGGSAATGALANGGAAVWMWSPAEATAYGPIAFAGGAASGSAGPVVGGDGAFTSGLPARPRLSLTGTSLFGGDLLAALPVTLQLRSAAPGELFVLLLDHAPNFAPLPGLGTDPLLVSAAAQLVFAGLTSATGEWTVSFLPDVHTPQWVDVPLHVQVFVFAPASGTWLGSNAEVRRLQS